MSEAYPDDYSESGMVDPVDHASIIFQDKIEKYYQYRCDNLRRTVLLLFEEHGALEGGVGWAQFDRLDSSKIDPVTGEMFLDQVLILVNMEESYVYAEDQGSIPIRIITNEIFKPKARTIFEKKILNDEQCLTIDFNLSANNESEYFINAGTLSEFCGARKNGAEIVPLLPIFLVENDELILPKNFYEGTPGSDQEFDDGNGGILTLYPFGDYKSYFDKVDSLGVGDEILSSIKNLTPRATSRNTYKRT